MDTLTANQAKTQFGDLLLKAQRAPIQINKNGKPVAVVLSMHEYEQLEAMKVKLLRGRASKALEGDASDLTDGDSFFDELEAGK